MLEGYSLVTGPAWADEVVGEVVLLRIQMLVCLHLQTEVDLGEEEDNEADFAEVRKRKSAQNQNSTADPRSVMLAGVAAVDEQKLSCFPNFVHTLIPHRPVVSFLRR